jgi:cell division protein FtsB
MDEPSQNKKSNSNSIISIVLLVMIGLYIAFLLYQSVLFNYQTNQRISSLQADIRKLEQDNSQLGVLIAYYKTDSFRELEARRKLGMKLPGEKVVTVEVKETPSAQSSSTQTNSEGSAKTSSRPNWRLWLDFIAGKLGKT